MEQKSLFRLITAAQSNDKTATEELYFRFLPTIKKYANVLSYDGAESDLTISFLEKIPHIRLTNTEDPYLINLIHTIIKNSSYDIFRKHDKIEYVTLIDNTLFAQENQLEEDYFNKLELHLTLWPLFKELSATQQKIIVGRYLNGLSDMDLAKHLGMSRQGVYKARNAAIKKLKEAYTH